MENKQYLIAEVRREQIIKAAVEILRETHYYIKGLPIANIFNVTSRK